MTHTFSCQPVSADTSSPCPRSGHIHDSRGRVSAESRTGVSSCSPESQSGDVPLSTNISPTSTAEIMDLLVGLVALAMAITGHCQVFNNILGFLTICTLTCLHIDPSLVRHFREVWSAAGCGKYLLNASSCRLLSSLM